MKTHELKTWPEIFKLTLSGEKRFEIRENDRNFRAGDELLLREYNPMPRGNLPNYTGRQAYFNVLYVMKGQR